MRKQIAAAAYVIFSLCYFNFCSFSLYKYIYTYNTIQFFLLLFSYFFFVSELIWVCGFNDFVWYHHYVIIIITYYVYFLLFFFAFVIHIYMYC